MEQEAGYIERAQAGEKEAFEVLMQENTGLVYHVAKRFEGRGVESEDLYQIGCLGLVKAVLRFDTRRGYCFSTYAVPVIMGEIKQYMRDTSSLKLSRELLQKRSIIGKCRQEYEMTHGRSPGVEELVKLTGFEQEEITLAMESLLPLESLDEPLGEEGKNRAELLPEGQDAYGLVLDRVLLSKLLGKLPKEERQLLFYRYYMEYTQSKTATLMGTNQVQISRREKAVLEKLRRQM